MLQLQTIDISICKFEKGLGLTSLKVLVICQSDGGSIWRLSNSQNVKTIELRSKSSRPQLSTDSLQSLIVLLARLLIAS